jgi:hypothetical protein
MFGWFRKSKEPKQIDILSGLRTSNRVLDAYEELDVTTSWDVITIESARIFLDALSVAYDLKPLKHVKIGFLEGYSDKNPNIIAYFHTIPSCYTVAFKNKSVINLNITLHEFAHYLDKIWNPKCQQTLNEKGVCNKVIANEFANKFYIKLWSIRIGKLKEEELIKYGNPAYGYW